jgi:hypothetical protein
MECPKCGRAVESGAFICPGCEFILDTSFLGDDITDDERDKRVGASPSVKMEKRVVSGLDFGEDAIILGDGQGEYSDFSSKDAGGMRKEVTQARFYIGGSTAALLHEDAVPEVVPGIVEGSIVLKMTPFERHVLSFINGKRSIARIHKKSGMEDTEFKASVAMLADKGLIRLRTTKKKKKKPGSLPSVVGVAPASSSQASGKSVSARTDPVPNVGERTVVAAFEPPDLGSPGNISNSGPKSAIAQAAALDDRVRNTQAKERRPSSLAASADEATVVKQPEQSRKTRLPGFASMRVEAVPDDDNEQQKRDAWGNEANVSNVFARVTPSKKPSPPSLVDKPVRAEVTAAREPSPLASKVQRKAKSDVERTGLLEREEIAADDLDEVVRRDDERAAREANEELVAPDGSPFEAVLDAFDDEPLRDPTGIGDLKPVSMRGGAALLDESGQDERNGFDDGADGGGDRDDVRDEDAEQAELEAQEQQDEREEQEERAAREAWSSEQQDAGGFDEEGIATGDHPVGSALSDEPTGPLPDPSREESVDARGDDDPGEGFDVELETAHLNRMTSAATASLPNKSSLPELPSDALQPLPTIPPPSKQPSVAPPSAQAASTLPVATPAITLLPPMPLPGQAPASPPPALPGQSLRAPEPARPAPPPALPGQSQPRPAIAKPAAAPAQPQRPPTGMGGLPGVRPSAASKVPFEQARKAEKIFEQATKDHAAGRISSARMNAKLAAMYDPTVPAYAEFLADLDAQGANAKPPGGGKPRELVLFEQANEHEGRGDYEKAVKLLEEAIAINPKAAALRNRLGVVLSIRLKRHSEALDQLRVAIELEPGNIVFMNNFSKVTALLDSQLEKGPQKGKKGKNDIQRVEVRKVRPKMF